MAHFAGGCLCGSVRYVISEPPVHTFYCHCTDCQKETGGPFATELFVKATSLRIDGELCGFQKKGDSGKIVTRRFCRTCGTTVVTVFESDSAHLCVKACTLDDASWLEPEFHLYVSSKQPWDVIADGLRQFKGDMEW
jgi:hypothetical protein